jgi:hypothetical protein
MMRDDWPPNALRARAGSRDGVIMQRTRLAVTQEWSIGTNQSANESGTVTLSSDGKSGSVDVDMLPDPPRPNPALKPIHVTGTFTCG